jgi:multisubunit Na+/H+ antiporter MnhB subunit
MAIGEGGVMKVIFILASLLALAPIVRADTVVVHENHHYVHHYHHYYHHDNVVVVHHN